MATPLRSIPRLEVLEGRTLPATALVTTTADGSPGSLRSALADPAVDTIQIAAGLSGQTLTLRAVAGELLIAHDVTITNLGGGRFTVSGGDANRVFEVQAGARVAMTGLIVTGGRFSDPVTAVSRGGGIYNGGTLTLTDCTVSGNAVPVATHVIGLHPYGTGYGGGISNAGTLTLIDCTVANNTIGPEYRSDEFGAGIYNTGTATLTGSTVAGNRATAGSDHGGGIYNDGGTLALTNCTVANNAAVGPAPFGGEGGGIEFHGGTAALTNCTVTANTAPGGGDMYNGGLGTPRMLNTIVAPGTRTGGDLFGAYASLGHNLIGDSVGSAGWGDTDIIGTPSTGVLNAKLGALQSNGGPTQTIALLAGSLAINAGTPAGAPATDQRGFSRASKAQMDIGAVGYQLPSPHVYAVATGPGTDSLVKVYNGDGSLRFSFSPYPGFTGGVQLAVGNVLGNGVDDIVTVPGRGGAPEAHVYDGRTGALRLAYDAYDVRFTGGIQVALADTRGTGHLDIVTVPQRGGSPEVRAFDGQSGALLLDFNAYDVAFTGGLTVAAGDTQGVGHASIVTAPGRGGTPEVRVFDGRTAAMLQDFNAYAVAFTGGITVAAADTAAQGYSNVVTAPGAGGTPEVHVYDGRTAALLAAFNAYDVRFTGGLTLALGDALGRGYADIVTVPGPDGPAEVHVYDGRSPQPAPDYAFNAYPTSSTVGVTLLVRDVLGSGYAAILTVPVAGKPGNVRVFDAAYRQTQQDFFPFDPTFLGGLSLG